MSILISKSRRYTMTIVPRFTLNTGAQMPAVGLGSWVGDVGGGERVYSMCMTSLEAGYRHFDTAAGYGNEAEVGRAVRDSGIPRSEVFVTTKLWSAAHHRVQEAFDASLEALGLDYIDLYLMHWPQAIIPEDGHLDTRTGKTVPPGESPTFSETWASMEKLLDSGKVRAIGVSNFTEKNLLKLLETAKVVPAANQMECHPSLPLHGLKELCDKHGILLVAYSPLGQPQPGVGLAPCFHDPAITKAADRTKSSPPTVTFSWLVQRGIAVIPKSETPSRIRSNIQLVELTQDEMAQISAIADKPGMHRSLLAQDIIFGASGKLWGWTTEDLGFAFDSTGRVWSP